MNKQKTYFLTGATGLVGSYLLKVLLEDGHRVYCLARDKNEKSAQSRLEEVLNFWDSAVLKKHKENLMVLTGDITYPNLGLDTQAFNKLRKEVDEVFHCAASIKFNLGLEKIYQINVGGTKKVLSCINNFNKLRTIHYLSTAYVGLFSKKSFTEEQMPRLQDATVMPYIKTKIEAEKIIEISRNKGSNINIYRLPFILGEYESGKTFDFRQTFYQFLHVLNNNIFDQLPFKNASNHFCFVDNAAKSLFLLSKLNQSGKNYHLFNKQKVSLETVTRAVCDILQINKPTFIDREKFKKNSLTPVKKKIFDINILPLIKSVNLDSSKTNNKLSQFNCVLQSLNKKALKAMLRYLTKNNFLKIKTN